MRLALLINFPFIFSKLIYFFSEWFFPKPHEIGSLVVRPWEMKENGETGRSDIGKYVIRWSNVHVGTVYIIGYFKGYQY